MRYCILLPSACVAGAALVLVVASCKTAGKSGSRDPAAASKIAETEAEVDFASEVRPILEANCLVCHHDKSNFTGLHFHTRQQILGQSSEDRPILVPGSPDESTLYLVTTLPGYFIEAMPAGKHRLDRAQRKILYRWIEQGARWPRGMRIGPPEGADIVIDGVL